MEVVAVQDTGSGQLVTYKKTESSTESSKEEEQPVRPAGQPYLAKINGRLVMARDKKGKQVNKGMDLLSHLFGGPEIVRVVKKHYDPPEQPKPQPLLLTNTTQGSQCQPMFLYSSQMEPRISSLAMQPIWQWPQQLQHSTMPPQTPYNAEPAEIRQAITDPQVNTNNAVSRNDAPPIPYNPNSNQPSFNTYNSTSMTITKHICVNCGRLRSRKYHHEHPIKPGEVPAPAFCAKCQKDATSTSSSSSSGRSRSRRRRKDKKKKKKRGKKRKSKEKKVESSHEENSDIQKPKKIDHDKGAQRKQASQKKRTYRRSEYVDDDSELDRESASFEICKNGGVSRRREASLRPGSYTQPLPARTRKDEYIREHRRPEEKTVYVQRERGRSPSIEYRFENERQHHRPGGNMVYMRRERDRSPSIQYRFEDRQYEPSIHEPTMRRETDKNKRRGETFEARCVEVVKDVPRSPRSPRSREQPTTMRQKEYELVGTHKPVSRQHLYRDKTLRCIPSERRHSVDSNDSGLSSHRDNSRRRRQERSQLSPGTFELPPSNIAHNINPQPGYGKVVVRETFVYKPRQSCEARDNDPQLKRLGRIDKDHKGNEFARYSRPDSRYENHEYGIIRRHKLRPQPGDEKVVVRETSVYGPRKSSQARDNDIHASTQRRGDESHKAHHIQQSRSLSRHDYDHGFEESRHPERSRSRNMSRERHRQDDWDTAEVDRHHSSPDQRNPDHYERHLPRAPSPPQSPSSFDAGRTQPPGTYSDSISGTSSTDIPAAYQAYDEARQRTPSRGREAVRNSSRHRQSHVRETTDGGTERISAPSPILHRPGEYSTSDLSDEPEDDRREAAEEEHIKRAHENHVTLREPSTSNEDSVVGEETSILEPEEDEHYGRHLEESGGGNDGGWGQHDGGGGDGDWGDSRGGYADEGGDWGDSEGGREGDT